MDDLFTCGRRRMDDDRRGLRLSYEVPGFGVFEERIRMPENAVLDPARDGPLVDLIHGVLGVSYYKLAPTESVVLPFARLGPAGREMLAAVYGEGLGEFRARNGLAQQRRVPVVNVAAFRPPPPAPPREAAVPRALVAFGGGKDSPVALELAREALRETAIFCVNPKPLHMRAAQAAGADLIAVARTLDPRLAEATAKGGLDGHVPITAVTSVLGVLAGQALRFDEVVFANERSADEPTAVIDDQGVNHQWSKSAAFEALLRAALAEIAAGPDYFSALRGLSELHVVRLFARLKEQHGVFSSCNRNFGGAASDRGAYWCGECPKCAFVGLALALFMPADAVRGLFTVHPLDVADRTGLYEDLTGLGAAKPWECVGTRGESAGALWRLRDDPAWAQAPVVMALSPRLAAHYGKETLERFHREAMIAVPAPHVPEAYADALDSL